MNQIIKEIGSIFSVQLLRTILQLAIVPILSRSLSPEIFGEFALVFSLYAVATKFRDFGIHHYVLANRVEELPQLNSLSLVVFYQSLGVSVLFLLSSIFILKSNLNLIWISIFSANIILSSYFNIVDSYYRGKGNLRQIFLVDRLHLFLFLLVNGMFIIFQMNLVYLLIINPFLIYVAQFTHFYKFIYNIITTRVSSKFYYNRDILRFFLRDLITPLELFGLNLAVNNYGSMTLGNYNRANVIASAPLTMIGQNLYNGLLAKNIIISRKIIYLFMMFSPVVFFGIRSISRVVTLFILGEGWDIAAVLLPFVATYYYIHWVSELGTLSFWRDGHDRLLFFKIWDIVLILILIVLSDRDFMNIHAILILLLFGKLSKGLFYVAKS